MESRHRKLPPRLPRRDLLKAGLTAAAALSAGAVLAPSALRAEPKRGGILRAWGYDPPHFDPQLILGGQTQNTLSFVYSRLLRHKVGAGVTPGTFTIEPDLAGITGSWPPYVKNYAPNPSFDYGGRAAALWLGK